MESLFAALKSPLIKGHVAQEDLTIDNWFLLSFVREIKCCFSPWKKKKKIIPEKRKIGGNLAWRLIIPKIFWIKYREGKERPSFFFCLSNSNGLEEGEKSHATKA